MRALWNALVTEGAGDAGVPGGTLPTAGARARAGMGG
jgi:hypothetical protein